MLKRSFAIAGVVGVAVFLLALGAWPGAGRVRAQAPDVAKVRIEITDNGFNGKSGEFVVEVQQGQQVELTFVWAQQTHAQDAHIIQLRGYGLQTKELSYYDREDTLKFVADKPGTFDFLCAIECEIHKSLQRGQLKVGRGAGSAAGAGASVPTAGAAGSITKPSLSLQGPSEADGKASLVATLKDAQNAPVPEAMVTFYAEGELAGIKGFMEIGKVKTGKDGVARFDYQPTIVGDQNIKASFEGKGNLAEAEQAMQLRVTAVRPYIVEPRGLEGIRDWAPKTLILTLLGVWSTFAFVIYQVVRISRSRVSAA